MNAIPVAALSAPAIPRRHKGMRLRRETLVFTALILLFNAAMLSGVAPTALIFSPDAVATGEWWRLFTHPFIHVSWYHLLLDAGAFLALYASLRETSMGRRLGCVGAAGLGSLSISWLVVPTLDQTGLCGLSGIAHGLAALTALDLMASPTALAAERRLGLITLLFVVTKVAWEAATSQAFLSFLHFGLMGTPVAASHAGGVLGAVLLFAVLRRRKCSLGRAALRENSLRLPGQVR